MAGRNNRAVRELGTRVGGASQQPVWSRAWVWAVTKLWQVMAQEICTVASGVGPYGGWGWGAATGKECRLAVALSGGL